MGQPQFGLGQQLQQVGHRLAKADLDHPPGHFAHFPPFEVKPQRRAALGRQRRCSAVRTVSPVMVAIGPGAARRRKDIACPSSGHDPAVSQREDHPPFLVECDQPFGGCRTQHLCTQRRRARVETGWRIADDCDADTVALALATAGQRAKRQRKQNKGKARRSIAAR